MFCSILGCSVFNCCCCCCRCLLLLSLFVVDEIVVNFDVLVLFPPSINNQEKIYIFKKVLLILLIIIIILNIFIIIFTNDIFVSYKILKHFGLLLQLLYCCSLNDSTHRPAADLEALQHNGGDLSQKFCPYIIIKSFWERSLPLIVQHY